MEKFLRKGSKMQFFSNFKDSQALPRLPGTPRIPKDPQRFLLGGVKGSIGAIIWLG